MLVVFRSQKEFRQGVYAGVHLTCPMTLCPPIRSKVLAEGRSLARTLPEPSAVRVYFLPCKREEAPGQGLIIPTRIPAPENSVSPPPGKGTVGRPVVFHPFIAVRPSASHPFLEKFFQKSNYSNNCCFCFIFSRGSARLFPKSLLWVLRVWKLGEGFLGTTSHQGLLGNKSLPQARPRRKSGTVISMLYPPLLASSSHNSHKGSSLR